MLCEFYNWSMFLYSFRIPRFMLCLLYILCEKLSVNCFLVISLVFLTFSVQGSWLKCLGHTFSFRQFLEVENWPLLNCFSFVYCCRDPSLFNKMTKQKKQL
uniref:Uncharacterized protein n=1 Tax=Rhizophora mucronata TaxID=61149 RepID=A0A2P2PRV0_RHIMU